MRRVLSFLVNMDAQAWRTLAVSFVLFGGVGLVFLFGAQVLGFSGEATVEQWMGAGAGPWALPVAVIAFAARWQVAQTCIVLLADSRSSSVQAGQRGALHSSQRHPAAAPGCRVHRGPAATARYTPAGSLCAGMLASGRRGFGARRR